MLVGAVCGVAEGRFWAGTVLQKLTLNPTHRLHSSSFSGLPYGILNVNHKKELLWSLRVSPKPILASEIYKEATEAELRPRELRATGTGTGLDFKLQGARAAVSSRAVIQSL